MKAAKEATRLRYDCLERKDAFKKAMDYMNSFVANDFTTPVPIDEDSKAVVAHNKYGV